MEIELVEDLTLEYCNTRCDSKAFPLFSNGRSLIVNNLMAMSVFSDCGENIAVKNLSPQGET